MKTALMMAAVALGSLGWSSAQAISEETPPGTCGNRLLAGVTCTGDFCDNIYLRCGTSSRLLYNVTWTGFVSEEGTGRASCYLRNRSGVYEYGFITGMACNGSYCDNVALECASAYSYRPDTSRCHYTNWVSEENSPLIFPAGYGAIRMLCSGSFCDNKSFLVCPIVWR